MLMDLLLFVKGLVIGFSIAAPVGPIGVLCIMRTLNGGRISGLLTGLGAATADGVYGCVAGFGIMVVSNALVEHQGLIGLLGGIFLVFLGVRILVSAPVNEPPNTSRRGLLGDYASTFILTLTNPMTIVSFAAVFASFGVGTRGGGYASAVILILGIVSGSALWWFTLSFGVGYFRSRFTLRHMGIVNKVAGVIVGGFGVGALVSLLI